MTSLFFSSSAIIALIRSSNCPRYLVPATIAAMSNMTTLLSKSIRETFLLIILKAKPSTIAVFPTPGSPISIGLFFLRLLKICETRSISSSLPIIGSSASSSASLVTSLEKLSNTGVFDLEFDLERDAIFLGLRLSSKLSSSSFSK